MRQTGIQEKENVKENIEGFDYCEKAVCFPPQTAREGTCHRYHASKQGLVTSEDCVEVLDGVAKVPHVYRRCDVMSRGREVMPATTSHGVRYPWRKGRPDDATLQNNVSFFVGVLFDVIVWPQCGRKIG